MCGTDRAFIYETGIAVKSQIATQICRPDNNGASRRARKKLLRALVRTRRRKRVFTRGSRTRADYAVVISDLSVRESRSVIPSGTGSRRHLAGESRCRYVTPDERSRQVRRTANVARPFVDLLPAPCNIEKCVSVSGWFSPWNTE